MFSHLKEIHYKYFNDICRTCMLMCDFKFFEDCVVLNVFFKLTDTHFETNKELPQQICLKCFEKINEIHHFTFQCKRTNLKLTKCLNISKKLQLNEEFKLNQIVLTEYKIPKSCELNDDQNLNFSEDDLKNICRTCMLTCDVKYDMDNVILDVCYKLTQIQFEKNDQLPNQICSKCYEKIIEIHTFSCVCKQTNSTLTECLNSNKKLQLNEEVNTDLVTIEKNSTNDELKIHENKLTEEKITETSKLNEATHSGDRLYKCEQCSESFCEFSNFVVHVRTHNGERLHICYHCSKSFFRLDQLKYHVHSNNCKRWYQCKKCLKSFNQLANFKSHMRVHSGECTYKCDQCLKSFCQLETLKTHMCVHYKCDQCSVSFCQSSSLNAHIRMHNDESLYKCEQCSKSFFRSSHLKSHMRVHSGERPYACGQCSKSFFHSSSLKTHFRTHHGKGKLK